MNYINNLFRYRNLLSYLVLRDVKVKYRRSFLGFTWSILNPLLMMAVIVTVFQNVFKLNIDNYPVYYLTGSIIYSFFSEATNSSLTSVLTNASLVKKVYIPKYIFPLEKCLFALVNALFSLVALVIVMIVLNVPFRLTSLLFVIPLLYSLIFIIGFSMIITTMNMFFRDISHLYSVFLSALFYMTPIIYPADAVPSQITILFKFNPLYYYITYLRELILYGYIPGLKFNLICFIFSFGALIIGLFIFKKNQDKFILYM